MPTFQIDRVEDGFRSWSPPDKPNLVFNYYTVHFAGEQGKGEADLKRAANEPAPTVNEVLEGYEIINKPGRRPELKQIKVGAQTGTASDVRTLTGKSSDFRSPEQLMMGDAIGKVLHWCDAKVAAGDTEKVKNLTWEQMVLQCNAMYQLIKTAP